MAGTSPAMTLHVWFDLTETRARMVATGRTPDERDPFAFFRSPPTPPRDCFEIRTSPHIRHVWMLATSNDCPHELFAEPRPEAIAPIVEIAFVDLLRHQMNHFGKTHCLKLRLEVLSAERCQIWLSYLR